MIRIAFVSHLSEVSGAGLALVRIAAGLDKSKFDCAMILPGNGPLTVLTRDAGVPTTVIENPETALGVRGFSALLGKRMRYVRSLETFLKNGGFHLVYINTSMTVFAGLAARRAHLPVLWHIHETIPKPSLGQRIKFAFIRRQANGFLFASETGRSLFNPPPGKPVFVARNPVVVANNNPNSPHQRNDAFGLREKDFVVLANGVNPAKGPGVLIQALAKLKNRNPEMPLKALIVGSPAPAHQSSVDQLKHRITQLGLSDTVQFPGYVQNLLGLLRDADVVVSPSHSESLPSFLVEAMAQQIPIVATSVGDCPKLLSGGALGQLVPPGDSSAMAIAIENVYRDPSRYREMAVKAQIQVASDYTPEKIWPDIENMIAAVARRAS